MARAARPALSATACSAAAAAHALPEQRARRDGLTHGVCRSSSLYRPDRPDGSCVRRASAKAARMQSCPL